MANEQSQGQQPQGQTAQGQRPNPEKMARGIVARGRSIDVPDISTASRPSAIRRRGSR